MKRRLTRENLVGGVILLILLGFACMRIADEAVPQALFPGTLFAAVIVFAARRKRKG